MTFVRVTPRGNSLSDEDAAQMKRMQEAIVTALQPFMGTTDPLVGVLALTRCLRVMLRNCTREASRALTPVLVDYLRGRITPRHEGLLWLPGEPRDN